MSDFSKITFENIKDVQFYLQNVRVGFCDFTPFVILMWQNLYKTEFTVRDSVLYLKYEIDGKTFYATPSDNILEKLDVLKSFENFGTLTLVSEEELEKLSSAGVVLDAYCDESYFDYVYNWENLSSLKGKKYAGQRNHINKFETLFPDWKYEKATLANAGYVGEFFHSISEKSGNLSHDFEENMVRNYIRNFSNFETLGGFVSSGGKIVSFAFGEKIGDMLFVHIEKADKSVQGAYPIIVREFARANPALYINREEDMGSIGLRTSKLSYHPEKLLKKYTVTIK